MCDDDRPPSKNFKTLATFKTDYNADSVEWCLHEPFKNVFVCANYQLKENTSERFGRILLFSFTSENDLELKQTLETAAVLDQKWCHCRINNRPILGVVNAKKSLEIYALNPQLVQLEFLTRFELKDEGEKETLLLSLDWSTGKYSSDEPHIVCSDSKGNIHMFRLINNELVEEGSWHGHEFEAWITAFYYWDPNVFFSGGDDCKLFKFDKRTGPQAVSCNRSHEAGVTSMHSNKKLEYTLATGSYDTNVRLWDIRHMKNPQTTIKTPGTLWRLKWDPLKYEFLLAACMLSGVHIISIQNQQIVGSYYEHKNIAYGADWSHLPSRQPLIASCSFYDNLLCISKVGSLE